MGHHSFVDEWCCKPELFNDGQCDRENNIYTCSYDGFDCCPIGLTEDKCPLPTDCDREAMQNSVCDSETNNPKCYYDMGVCTNMTNKYSIICSSAIEGDGICDLQNNMCGLDATDCTSGFHQDIVLFLGIGTTSKFSRDHLAIMSLNGTTRINLPRFPIQIDTPAAVILYENTILVCGGRSVTNEITASCFSMFYETALESELRKGMTQRQTDLKSLICDHELKSFLPASTRSVPPGLHFALLLLLLLLLLFLGSL
jgi:hypothetical protein